MRVDWSKNLAEGTPDQMATDPLYWFLPGAQTIGTGSYVGEGDDPLLNPDRPIIRPDYIDFVTKEMRTPEYSACLRLFDTLRRRLAVELRPGGDRLPQLAAARAGRRSTSRCRTPTARSCVTRRASRCAWRLPRTTRSRARPRTLAENGLTGDDCTEASLDQFAKFGFFRTVRPTYDRQIGATEEGRQYFINRWNIWKETIKKDADGMPFLDAEGNPHRIDPAQRETRTITYY